MSDIRKKAYEKLNSFLKQSLWPLAYRDYLKSLDALYASEFSDQAFQSITEQTLADVQAGIPARDAEIEALRKENKELREQLEAVGAGGVNGRLMPGAAPVSAEPVAQVAEDFIFFLRKQPNGERWPVGTKLYAAPDGAMERALTELVDKIVPGLDTGDLLADAATASKALDSAQQDADKVYGERYIFLRDYAGQSWDGWIDQPHEKRSDEEIDEFVAGLKSRGEWSGPKRNAGDKVKP